MKTNKLHLHKIMHSHTFKNIKLYIVEIDIVLAYPCRDNGPLKSEKNSWKILRAPMQNWSKFYNHHHYKSIKSKAPMPY